MSHSDDLDLVGNTRSIRVMEIVDIGSLRLFHREEVKNNGRLATWSAQPSSYCFPGNRFGRARIEFGRATIDLACPCDVLAPMRGG